MDADHLPGQHESAARRGRRFRLAITLILGLLAAVLAIYLVATFSTRRLVLVQVEALRRAGQPVRSADLAPPPVADDQNAAVLYAQVASDADSIDTQLRQAFGRHDLNDAFAPPHRTLLHQILEQHDLTFQKLEQAGRQPGCRFSINWSQPDRLLPHYAWMRAIVRALGYRAREQAQTGQAEAAYRSLAASLQAARHLSREPTLIGQLLRYACSAISLRSLSLVIELTPPTPQQVRMLWPLLDGSDLPRGLSRALAGERAEVITIWATQPPAAVVAMIWGPSGPTKALGQVAATVGGPLYHLSMAHYLELMARAVKGAALPPQQAQPALAQVERDARAAPAYLPLAEILVPSFIRAREATDRAQSLLALARWALALSLYQQRHGRYPAQLSQAAALAPGPPGLDPVSGKLPIYRPRGKGYQLYCVGPDGQDNGGQAGQGWNAPDLVWPPPARYLR